MLPSGRTAIELGESVLSYSYVQKVIFFLFLFQLCSLEAAGLLLHSHAVSSSSLGNFIRASSTNLTTAMVRWPADGSSAAASVISAGVTHADSGQAALGRR